MKQLVIGGCPFVATVKDMPPQTGLRASVGVCDKTDEQLQLSAGLGISSTQVMETSEAGNPELFLHVSFGQRWEYHKSTIYDLYITQGRSIEDVAAVMKGVYSFDANVRQFKYHLKKWDFTKAVPKAAKDKVVKAIGKRLREGKSVGTVRYKGENIDKKRIRRYLRHESRLNQDWKLITVVFGTWNLPYLALKASLSVQQHPSPFGGDWSTPREISFSSPQASAGGPSPGHASSPANAQTPTTMAIRAKAREDRAKFLIQGRGDELLKDLSRSEKRIAATWLYELWFFAFTTSKYWGRGPRHWTPDLLRFRHFQDMLTAPNSPGDMMDLDQSAEGDNEPTSLCSWSIHCWLPCYERNRSPSPEEEDDIEIGGDPQRWPRWSRVPKSDEFRKYFREGLQLNSFSTLEIRDVPLATSKVAIAASNSPEMLQVESIGFAIIARNVELLEDLLNEDYPRKLNLSSLFPYHLAANYLDGAEACCSMLDSLVSGLGGTNLISKLYVNDYGHTVLDSLMITIMKSHTMFTPSIVDERFRKTQRFTAEDVDICGRWDADSFCVRQNNAKGSPCIPKAWKHPFCHTSAQAVCHAAIVVFGRPYSPDINTRSGIFTKSCSKCHRRLEPGPLHTLIITAYHLAQGGFEGETLFGVLACLVCLLTLGADPTLQTEMSVDELLGTSDGRKCYHGRLDPVELAEQVPEMIRASWLDDVQVGWQTLLAVLRFAQRERGRNRSIFFDRQRLETYFDFDGAGEVDQDGNFEQDVLHHHGGQDSAMETDDGDEVEGWCRHGKHYIDNFYCGSKKLGTLWAAVQTEMLTYRRLQGEEAWLSARFSMKTVQDGANSGDGFSSLTFVELEMMKPWCVCGRFQDARTSAIPTMEEACSFYFSNMEDWERSNYLRTPYMEGELDSGLDLNLDSDVESSI
ncbi:hypothetical protein RRF57_011253 [Xylaria bambusicola]|uniref:Clr5 domain-containing protein n=1 Tax=Xylaria bambusicola TaxID=326684 RepID=A0AAN7ZD06_9PEZI